MSWLPQSILADESVGKCDELSHDGCEGNLWPFAVGDKPGVEALQVGVAAGSVEGGHVETGAQAGASAFDAALALRLTAVAGDRRQAGNHGGLFSRAPAQLARGREAPAQT